MHPEVGDFVVVGGEEVVEDSVGIVAVANLEVHPMETSSGKFKRYQSNILLN